MPTIIIFGWGGCKGILTLFKNAFGLNLNASYSFSPANRYDLPKIKLSKSDLPFTKKPDFTYVTGQ